MGDKAEKLRDKTNSNSEVLLTWIIGYLEDSTSSGGALATEATLQSVLSAIQDGQDYESKLVVDNNGNGATYLEVRIWNPDTQSWEAPLYYAPGSNTGLPLSSLTAPVIYINPNTLLSQIAANTTSATGVAVNGPDIVTNAGTVAAGKRKITFFNSGDVAVDINGGTNNLQPGVVVTFEADGKDTLASVGYDATGGELTITSIG